MISERSNRPSATLLLMPNVRIGVWIADDLLIEDRRDEAVSVDVLHLYVAGDRARVPGRRGFRVGLVQPWNTKP
jgi:hypothetical protein